MVMGAIGGLIMTGLLAGAISGSAWLLLGFSAAGMLIAGIYSMAACYRRKASYKLTQYPPYGY